MKRALLYAGILLLILPSSRAAAQDTFAPVGAEWYYDMAFGVFHSKVRQDTTINGVGCRQITVDPMIRNPQQSPNVHGYRFFVYEQSDTVFIYNEYFEKFTPLYVFNVNEGDTVYLPVIPPMGGKALSPVFADSLFCFVVDSVRIKTWDNEPLKTVYTHHLNRMNLAETFPDYSYGPTGVYVEQLGAIEIGFLPDCLNCISLLDESNQLIGAFRCYHENMGSGGLAVELVDTCDAGISTGIGKLKQLPAAVTIYPNPAVDQVDLSFSVPFPQPGSWSVTDLTARPLLQGKIAKGRQQLSINLGNLPAGMYFLTLHTTGFAPLTQKIVVTGSTNR